MTGCLQVTFTVNTRPWYLRQVLEAWKNVRQIEKVDRWHFQLEPSTQVVPNVRLITEFAASRSIEDTVTYEVNERKLGVLSNPHRAVSHVFDTSPQRPPTHHDMVILAEEDVEPAEDALEYLLAVHNLHASDPTVLGACCWQGEDSGADDHTYLRRRYFAPWLWATWRDRWEHTISATWDHKYARGGWDVNLGLNIVNERELDFLFPAQSRSLHVGRECGSHQDPARHDVELLPHEYQRSRPKRTWQEGERQP